MNDDFTPFDNESDVVRIDDLEVENRVDRVSLNGDLVLTRDQTGLVLARELQTLIGQVVAALEAEKQLPQTVALKPAETVKNPFS
ncbi:MAG: hypothetical protein ABIO19_05495 [Burkholderiaceae bacterium]